MKKYFLPLIIVLLFSFLTIKPLFMSGFFPVHDDTQVQRVYEMWSSLKDGMFPVRWVPDLGYGYGYPIFNFYGPLAYYIGGLFVFITGNALLATKILFGIGILLAGVSMYFFIQELAGKYAGIIGAVLYMYAPYHAVNIYVRGDVAEFFAYAFLPLIFYGIVAYLHTSSRKALVLGSLGYAGLILSHNLSAMMVTPFIGILLLYACIVFGRKEVRKSVWLLFVPLVGVSIAAFYWLPTLLEMRYTNVQSVLGGGSDFRDHFVCLSQLWSSPWGYGGSIPGCVDGMSLQLGKIQIIFFAIGVGVAVWKRRWDVLLLSILGGVSVFLLLPVSRFIWESISVMSFFQFPWRFLLPASFFFSAVSGVGVGMLVETFSKKAFVSWIGTLIICVGIVLYGAKFFTPQTVLSKTSADYTSSTFLKWDTSKISDEYMPKGFTVPSLETSVIQQKIQASHSVDIQVLSQKTNYQKYQIRILAPERVNFFTAFFPAWHLFVNGEEKTYDVTPVGLSYTLPESGTYTLELKFLQTPVERVANVISVIGVLVLSLAIIKKGAYEKNS